MKHTLKVLLFVLLASMLQECNEDETLHSEKVQFACSFKSTDAKGGRLSSLPEGSTLRVSIETKAGKPVLTNYTITLLNLSGSFVTEPIDLKPGAYKIVEFLIVTGSEVLYAVPRKGTTLASAVIHPLDFEFNVVKNILSTIDMDVISVKNLLPQDFGYTSFSIGIVNTFELSVFYEKNKQLSLTSGLAYILQGTDTVRKFILSPTVNRISFRGDDEKTYILSIIKDGYGRFTEEFVPKDFITSLNNKAFKVFLVPAFTMLAYSSNESSNEFKILVQGEPGGGITINWGDGSVGEYPLLDFESKSHTYPTQGNYFISITGDLSQVYSFSSYYGQGIIDRINLEHLPNLKDIRCGLTRGPKVLDLSNNFELEFFDVSSVNQLERIKLPSTHNIYGLYISGPNKLNTVAVDSIISNIHSNTVAKNINEGIFSLEEKIFGGDGSMVGPPSAEALIKLRELRDEYGWNILPKL